MGWYHAENILANRCPSAALHYIVEPFYMKAEHATVPGYETFHTWRKEQESKAGIQFYETVAQVPAAPEGELRMGIITGRTADNPALLEQCLKIGCQTIYLEKPGAPTVQQLKEMRDSAVQAGCHVFMGFNKNVSAYVTRARDFASQQETTKCDVTFLHNNAYPNTDAALAECFERNAEGMLKNMAIHELAILVTYYNVTVANIAKVEVDKDYSSCRTLQGPDSSKDFTDFVKLKFKIVTKTGQEASVAADRCGGDDSVGIVTDSITGKELARYSMPDNDAVANSPALEKIHPGAMPYFFTQDPDYCALKQKIAQACVDTDPSPPGVATIDTAIEALSLAEHLTVLLQEQLKE
jgi:predicted dehydrogenase